jgi:hypothetical protein
MTTLLSCSFIHYCRWRTSLDFQIPPHYHYWFFPFNSKPTILSDYLLHNISLVIQNLMSFRQNPSYNSYAPFSICNCHTVVTSDSHPRFVFLLCMYVFCYSTLAKSSLARLPCSRIVWCTGIFSATIKGMGTLSSSHAWRGLTTSNFPCSTS